MTALMVQGVCSGAGKSLVVTALCRWLRDQGVRVAPFKAQNMSNNARVGVGGEMGTAQWLQANAAGIEPDVRMNPILLKPESDTRSQVVVNGVVDHELTRAPWRGRSHALWPHVEAAFRSLQADVDLIVIEGAGSPAETNLWADDIVNMRVADLADAPVLLVADIDRGGAFAHLYGTWALLPPAWQQRIEGFLLNKFRGDASLLDPAPAKLAAATGGIPTIGVLPMLDHALPDEEGPTRLSARPRPSASRRVAVVCGPYASNLDEFVALQQSSDVHFVSSPQDTSLLDVDMIVLPGSKNVVGDLAWMRAVGLDRAVVDAARRDTAVLGICGGMQLLGHRIDDPHGVEGGPTAPGLGLLDVDTVYGSEKLTERVTVRIATLGDPWRWLSDAEVDGYEIRLGITQAREGGNAREVASEGRAFATDNVLGVSFHGVFERAGAFDLDGVFRQLARAIEEHVDTNWLRART
jgi:adenosylcobyric acid synthase